MIRSRTRGLYNAHILAICALMTVTFWGYLLILMQVYPAGDDLQWERYPYYNVIALIGLLLRLLRGDERDLSLFGNDPFHALREASAQIAYVAGALMFTLLLTKDRAISRFFLFTYLPMLWVLLAAANAVIPRYLSSLLFRNHRVSEALLIGPESRVANIRRWIRYMERFGVRVTGLLCDDNRSDSVFEIPVIGKIADLDRIVEEREIQSVVLLEIPSSQRSLNHILDVTESHGIRLVALNNLDERFHHAVNYFDQFGLSFITLREEPLEDPLARMVKRAMDVAVSLPLVLCAVPVLAVIVWIMQKVQSPGPLFFRQKRTGTQKRHFEMLKFRTMHVTNDDAARQATEGDERVYPFGRFLRKTSLDEFPQFINVLRGEMSLVGPRPHMPEHDAMFTKVMSSYPIRSLVKPGVTGLAQVRGYRGEAKNNDDVRQRVLCDIEYIEQWSPLLDLYIILRTAWVIFFPPKTAY